ncbi:hypothetical protein [Legionella birminghamensis]|nr:hypothetical protein [Legionella birminghamensis]
MLKEITLILGDILEPHKNDSRYLSAVFAKNGRTNSIAKFLVAQVRAITSKLKGEITVSSETMSVLMFIMLGIMLILKIFALRSGAQTINHYIDCMFTYFFTKKMLEKKAIAHGFLVFYEKELEHITPNQNLITQWQCHYAFRVAQYKHSKIGKGLK